jgi:hypothetical protein
MLKFPERNLVPKIHCLGHTLDIFRQIILFRFLIHVKYRLHGSLLLTSRLFVVFDKNVITRDRLKSQVLLSARFYCDVLVPVITNRAGLCRVQVVQDPASLVLIGTTSWSGVLFRKNSEGDDALLNQRWLKN